MQRRSFFSRLAGAGAFFGLGSAAPAFAAPAGSTFEAARHEQDAWLDQMPGKHRIIFDTWTADKFREGVGFTNNYVRTSKDAYGLAEKDMAVVICARHHTAPFAFNDAMWGKYGKYFSDRMSFVDPRTKQPPAVNPYTTPLTNLVKQGTHFAICNLTTRAYTKIIADATGGNADDVYKEIAANTVGNSHFVPAGVIAVSRAQEYGYTTIAIG